MVSLNCLILAGGFHNRIYSIVGNKPKALLEYKGKPVITYLVERIPENIPILVSTNKKFEADFYRWKKTIDREIEIGIENCWSGQEKIGAVSSIDFWIKQKAIVTDLLVIAGDNYFEFDLSEFITSYDSENPLVAVYNIKDKGKAGQFGVVELKGNRIVRFEEKQENPKTSLVSTGCYIFPSRIFPLLSQLCQQPKDNLGHFIAYLVEKDSVLGYIFTEPWFDIGVEIFQSNKLQRRLVSTVNLS